MSRRVTVGRHTIVALIGLLLVLLLPRSAVAAECEFLGRFKAFRDLIPNEVGECTENASLTEFGSEQRTTNGILYWIREDNEVEFTNGLHTWVYGENGLESIPHDEIAQLRGFMARSLMKEAVEDYIIEYGMMQYVQYEDGSIPLSARAIEVVERSYPNLEKGSAGYFAILGTVRRTYGIAVSDRFNWRQAWDRLNPNQEGVHHYTPTWLIEWLDLPYSEQWQIHQVSAEQMLLLQEVWFRRYHSLTMAAYSETFSGGADWIRDLTDKGCLPTTPVVSLTQSNECWYDDVKYLLYSDRKTHDYVRLVAMWWVIHGYTGTE